MKRKRGVAVKKRLLKKRTRGVTVPILNLPRPPCPVLMNEMMNDDPKRFFKFAETLHTLSSQYLNVRNFRVF